MNRSIKLFAIGLVVGAFAFLAAPLFGDDAVVVESGKTAGDKVVSTAPSPATVDKNEKLKVKIPELCESAVDPFRVGLERKLFFRAAGKDRKLSRVEFDASQKDRAAGKESFARIFDRWAGIKSYDVNKDSLASWPEVESYRRAFRREVMNKFDTNHDGRLKGPERNAANKAINSGELFASGVKGSKSSSLRAAGDKDPRDMTEEERKAASQEMFKKANDELYAKYDTDGDGELDKDEQAAMHEQDAQHMQKAFAKIFDENEDGEIQPDEQSHINVFSAWGQDIGELGESYLYDLDQNGKVSSEERMEVMGDTLAATQDLMDSIQEYADTDGDGEISDEEGQALGKRIMNSFKEKAVNIHDDYDLDGDGVLNEYEHNDMILGVRYQVIDNYSYYDQDGNGILNKDERKRFYQGMILDMLER